MGTTICIVHLALDAVHASVEEPRKLVAKLGIDHQAVALDAGHQAVVGFVLHNTPKI
jgi:hypothetical protein